MIDNKNKLRPGGSIESNEDSVYESKPTLVNVDERIDDIDFSSIVPKPNRSLIFEQNVIEVFEYIQAKLSADQTKVWGNGDPVHFDTADSSSGDISVDSGGRFSTLKAGRTYILRGSVNFPLGSDHRPFSWHNVTDDVYMGSYHVTVSSSENSAIAYNQLGIAIVTPSTDIEVEFRCRVGHPATLTAEASNPWGYGTTAVIHEIRANMAYIQAKLSANQTQTWAAGDPVHFDTADSSSGDISVDSSGKFSTLKAGRTYVLQGSIHVNGGATRLPFSWHNVTDNVAMGSYHVAVSPSLISVAAYNQLGIAIVTPSTDIEVEFRCRAAATVGGALTVEESNAWLGYGTTALIYEI